MVNASKSCGFAPGLFQQEFLDLFLQSSVIRVALDILAAGVDVADAPGAIEQEGDAGPLVLAVIKMPLPQGLPLRVDG
jgi:hypothetical protein